jgi:hypothetical protein
MKKTNCLIICSILLVSCNRKQELPLSSKKETIEIRDSDLKKNFKGSEIFENVKLVPLETNDESIIGTVSKIVVVNNTIYIFDTKSRSVLMFDKQGRYLNKIHKVGQGPNEYIDIEDFAVMKNEDILVLDENKKLIQFNKNTTPSQTYKLPFYADAIECLNDSILIFNGSSFDDKVIVWDLHKERTIGTFLKFDPKTSARILKPLIKYEDQVYFTYQYSSTIYNVTSQGIEEKWFIDFGNRNIKMEDLRQGVYGIYIPPSSSSSVYNFTETQKYIVFNFQCDDLDDGYPYYVCYSKASKTKKIFSQSLFENDITFNLYSPNLIGVSDSGEFIEVLDTYSFLESIASHSKTDTNTDKYKRWRVLMDDIAGVNEFDNPIIAFYVFKEF